MRFFPFLAAIFLVQSAHAAPVSLTISAAASLKNVLSDLGETYEKTHPDADLHFNFASSGTLQRQIEQGAPIDIYIAAADKNVAELKAKNLVVAGSRRVLAGNHLVLIVPKNGRLSIKSFRDLVNPKISLAIGAPSVPAGQRAQEVFEKIGIWPQVQARAVRAKDVRDVLSQVELGNVDCGVVYSSDAAISRQSRAVSLAPDSFHQPIRYPAIVTTWSQNPRAAQDL